MALLEVNGLKVHFHPRDGLEVDLESVYLE